MLQQTALYETHRAAGGKLVDFGGWAMPLHYGSQLEEHHCVRRQAGLFDVSHMTLVDIDGDDARDYLRRLLANDVARLDGQPGKALYSAMLNERGGVIDDLIVYNLQGLDEQVRYRAVVNCATRDKDLAWMQGQIQGQSITLRERADLAMLALQGPQALAVFSRAAPDAAQALRDLPVFSAARSGDWLIGRTGYTGEDGLEIMLPGSEAPALWDALAAAGAAPCGLGARDTLRLEAGMNLYGHEMDEQTSPLVANMGWTIAWQPPEREFIGRAALAAEKDRGITEKLVGLVLRERGIMRAGQSVTDSDGNACGIITSGSFSPTLGQAIALARVPAQLSGQCRVDIRGKLLSADIVKPVFVRHGDLTI